MRFDDAIFVEIQKQYNNLELTNLPHPPCAEKLATYENIEPNDNSIIKHIRTYKWIKANYKTTLKDYNEAFKLWSKGTGGGPGSSENINFCD